VIYVNKKNPSRMSEIYECLFELKQRDKFAPEFYGEVTSLIDELKVHQPAVTDAATLMKYRDLAVSKVSVWLESLTTIPGMGSDT